MTPISPQRHDPPEGWPLDVFARVTDAIAAALVASWRRDREQREERLARAARGIVESALGEHGG